MTKLGRILWICQIRESTGFLWSSFSNLFCPLLVDVYVHTPSRRFWVPGRVCKVCRYFFAGVLGLDFLSLRQVCSAFDRLILVPFFYFFFIFYLIFHNSSTWKEQTGIGHSWVGRQYPGITNLQDGGRESSFDILSLGERGQARQVCRARRDKAKQDMFGHNSSYLCRSTTTITQAHTPFTQRSVYGLPYTRWAPYPTRQT